MKGPLVFFVSLVGVAVVGWFVAAPIYAKRASLQRSILTVHRRDSQAVVRVDRSLRELAHELGLAASSGATAKKSLSELLPASAHAVPGDREIDASVPADRVPALLDRLQRDPGILPERLKVDLEPSGDVYHVALKLVAAPRGAASR